MASIGSDDHDIGFQIAPMVDVVFVLMLFFMACACGQVAERELNVNLPGGNSPARSEPITPIIIDISGDGQVSMNSKVYGIPDDHDLNSLREFFETTIKKFGDKDPVILRPKPETRHERIMDVLNAAGASGVTKLTFS